MTGGGGRIQRKGEKIVRCAVFWSAGAGKRLGSICGGNQKLREGIGKLL
jgi:hypothetical protein